MSFVSIPDNSHFSLRNIPFGIISTADRDPRPAVRIGDHVLDLKVFTASGGFSGLSSFKQTNVFEQSTLNKFAELGRPVHRAVREYIQEVLKANGKFSSILEENKELKSKALLSVDVVKTHLPLQIGDYTDFYAGRNHAYNCGCILRSPQNALQPNYYHIPVGYHGRASSVVISGTPIHRPYGQVLTNPKAEVKVPEFIPTRRLDYELEFAAFISKPNDLGHRIDVNSAEDYIFGYVLMNDWSARDVQAWEYVPLGPFTAKNFGTVVSPWVVLHDALVPFKAPTMERPPDVGDVLDYLKENDSKSGHDIDLEVEIRTKEGQVSVVSHSNTKFLLFSFPQMIAHHTVTGCNLQTGDLLGSGTISGESDAAFGSLLEITKGGSVDVKIGSSTRKFIEDGDVVTFRGVAKGDGEGLVGFGDVACPILPAIPYGKSNI
ncbi:fumarylacetoacetase [Sugiyamaella lignohabitans]|uniref:Fumarylacetoacetase n=1 Tax=Sugiyamaella lignohabitans TaxID=796027 RepID=A0A167FD32_9ASCO|nr:fumarylacetoacetase [Sugiyamaella lignohabitans]ANB15142.1 fumarylacetoacetase [Sugiyamaella lignohabitans]